MGASGSTKLPQIILFGDSLTEWGFEEETQGFGWHLQTWYRGKAEIVNEGYAGYTSQIIKRDFQRLIDRITTPSAPPTLLITIFLGANDACFVGKSEYVPLPNFEANIREFVETILTQDNLPDTKVILITPPPINIPDPLSDDDDEPVSMVRRDPKSDRGYRTYMSKKRYADKIVEIAAEYEETGRIASVNFWKACIDAALGEQGREGEGEGEKYDEDRLPGCGLKTARQFRKGYFTDGLHLGALGYNVLSKALVDTMLGKWPELAPDTVEV